MEIIKNGKLRNSEKIAIEKRRGNFQSLQQICVYGFFSYMLDAFSPELSAPREMARKKKNGSQQHSSKGRSVKNGKIYIENVFGETKVRTLGESGRGWKLSRLCMALLLSWGRFTFNIWITSVGSGRERETK